MKHLSLTLLTACLLLLLQPNMAVAQCNLTPPAKVPLGANLNELTDYSRDRVFNDVFKLSRQMSANVEQPFNIVPVATDANGWPLADFGVVVMTEMDSTMGGTYKIQFNGQATITPEAGGFTVANQVYNAAKNITTADLKYPLHIANGNVMFIGFTNTHFSAAVKGIKNIKIMKPGLAFNAPTFSQKFLDHIARFDCLRFMDWHETNNNEDSLWTKRWKKNAPTQQNPTGTAWEYVIELANTLNKDVWINVPHKVNDNYITNLAKLFKDSLNASLNIYVEYSNEVWNGQFGQTQWVNDRSLEDGNKAGSAINFDNVNDQFTWRARYIAKRAKEISDKFSAVFGAAALNNRVRVVLAQQYGFFDFTVRGVDFINAFFGKPGKFFYAIAVAPYFNAQEVDAVNSSATPAQILNELDKQVNILNSPFNNVYDMWAARAAFYGLKLVAYEGGPDTFGGNNINAKTLANRNIKMRAICKKYLAGWYKYGFFSLFNWFTAGAADYNTPFGTWSLTENFEASQKLLAIDSIHNFLIPDITAGQVVTATVDPRKFAGYDSTKLANTFFQPSNGFPFFYEYLIRVPAGAGGTYKITFQTCANNSGQSYKIELDDSLIKTITPVNNNFSKFVNVVANTKQLKEGLHAIRLTPVGGFNFRISAIKFALTAACNGLWNEDAVADALKIDGRGKASIFPNPSINKTAVLSYTLTLAEKVRVQLMDINGHIITSTSLGVQQAGTHQLPLHAKGLAQAIYFVRLNTGNTSSTLKWLVK